MLIMVMMHNPFEELNRKIDNIEKKVDLLLRRTGKIDLFDEFNVEGLTAAAEILNFKSTSTLNKKIKKGDTLKKNIHYRKSSSGKYSFSKSALLSVKGIV